MTETSLAKFEILMNINVTTSEQGFPTWGTCIPGGTFAYLKGYIYA